MARNVVPALSTDNVPIHGLDDLDNHLDELIEDPNTQIEAKLFDDVELQLTGPSELPHSKLASDGDNRS
jgi:hypothetical protein